MAGAKAGVVGQAELNSPQGSPIKAAWTPATWAWIWFGVAVFIVLGFHIRIFGSTFPPNASLP